MATIPKSLHGVPVADLATFTRTLLVKDRIQQAYKAIARIQVALRKDKRESGFCSSVYSDCMVYTGDGSVCAHCKDRLENPRFKYGKTAYGRMRQRERETARLDKETSKVIRSVRPRVKRSK